MDNLRWIRRIRAVAVSGLASMALALTMSSVASAAPINLDLLFPDLFSGIIDIAYDSANDELTLTGSSFEYNPDGSGLVGLDVLGTYSVTLEVDGSGNLVPNVNNTIEVTGEYLGFTSGTLITGDIIAFGFVGDSNGLVLEFLFTPTGGDLELVGDYGLFGEGGSIVGTGSNTFSDWNSDWDNLIFSIPSTGSGTSDTAPTPEPSTGLMVVGGLVALAVRNRSRRRA